MRCVGVPVPLAAEETGAAKFYGFDGQPVVKEELVDAQVVAQDIVGVDGLHSNTTQHTPHSIGGLCH